MEYTDLKIGDILRVKLGDEYHYEKVVQITPVILTENMPEGENEYVSSQWIAPNLQYELISPIQISTALKQFLPLDIVYSIVNRFYGSDSNMDAQTFKTAIADTKYSGVNGIPIADSVIKGNESGARDWLLDYLSKPFEVKLANGSATYYRDGHWIFYQEFKNRMLWCYYYEVWSIFETKFGMNFEEVRALYKEVEALNCKFTAKYAKNPPFVS